MSEVTDATLRTTEKNKILELLTAAGFTAADFEWSEEEQTEEYRRCTTTYAASVLTHCKTKYYFVFGPVHTRFSPGESRKVETQRTIADWESQQLGWMTLWLRELRKEVDAPDLWASIAQERVLPMAASATVDNRLFTPAEHNLIHAKLDEIKVYLMDGQQFTTEQSAMIERELAYLRESSQRLGRKDWLNNLLGGVVGLAIGLALDPDKARGLLGLAGSAFQSLWNVAHTLLQ